jgi:dTDP-4-dehydrorhamnose 3,5-epimerase-like enzyme
MPFLLDKNIRRLSMDFEIAYLIKHNDHRGYLVEFLKGDELNDVNKTFGQIYYVTFNNENVVRGNHYHKQTEEWFGVIFGSLLVVLEDVNTQERKTFELHSSENEFVRLRIGKGIAHAFKCLSKSAILLDYANRQYDPTNSDRFHYTLL